MRSVYCSIRDTTTPMDKPLFVSTVKEVTSLLKETPDKENVVVHCMGGLSRTGTFAMAVLKCAGVIDSKNWDLGLRCVGAARQGAGGNYQQQLYVQGIDFD